MAEKTAGRSDGETGKGGVSRRAVLGWGTAAGAGTLLLGALPAGATGVPDPRSGTGATFDPGLTPFPQQGDLNFETLFAYGETAYHAGEVGEVATTVAAVQAAITKGGAAAIPAYEPYVTAFETLAVRLAKEAAAERAAGHLVSAREKYLRAASYYNCALFFVLGTSKPGREPQLYAAMQAQWAAAAALLRPAYQRVLVPAKIRFPNPAGQGAPVTRVVNIPAYYVRAAGAGRRPTVIINNGSDGQLIDVFAFGAQAAVERGYNALIFEGPGQGSLLFQQNIPFTPYWQDVITPLVDFLVRQPEVDPGRIGMTGWSFGGVLVFRAAAYEPRIAAVVSDPGFVDNSAAWSGLTAALTKYFGAVTNANWKKLYESAPPNGEQGQRALNFLINKRAEIYAPVYRDIALKGGFNPDLVGLLSRVASYNADDALLSRVRAHVLIDTYEADEFWGTGQADKLQAGLKNARSITRHYFDAAAGAEYHCAPLAPQVRNAVVYDWFDEVLVYGNAPAEAPAPVVAPAAVS